MYETRLWATLVRLARDLDDLGCRWALVGGLALAVRVEPRTTRDVDAAVTVDGDAEAERIIRSLFERGYQQKENGVHEDRATERLWVMRLISPGDETQGTVVDLLFYSSRIEAEVVAAADRIAITRELVVPVARTGHLLAIKLFANRRQDLVDVEAIVRAADPAEIERARQALRLIERRNDIPDRDLLAELEEFLPGKL